MKVLAAVATLAMVAAIGVQAQQAAEKTARLYDPATPGEEQVSPPRKSEDAARAPAINRTGLSAMELQRIRDAISDHVRAVSSKNPERLFDTLSPVIQEHYGTSDRFLKALQNELVPLTQVRTYAFGPIAREAEDALQTVIFADTAGREWEAEFRLQRQGDGRWVIHGCLVEPAIGPQA